MDNTSIKISIIVPIYNTEKYLSECIESILNQSYDNIELLLINDGSPDNSDDICKKYFNIDSRVKYFYKENEGVSIARNLGIEKATGNYIFCMDSDDTIEHDFIKKIVNICNKSNADMIIIGKSACKKNTKLIGALPTCCFTIKKDFFNKHTDIRFAPHIQPCEDGLLSHEILALTNNIAKCSNAKYFYRQHALSSEHSLNSAKILSDIHKWFDILTEFYNKYNLWDTRILHLLSFIYEEPFGLRFNRMNLSNEEKKYLFDLIHEFLSNNKINITKKDLRLFPQNFYLFIKSQTYEEFKEKLPFTYKEIVNKIFSLKTKYEGTAKFKILTILGIKKKFRVRNKLY